MEPPSYMRSVVDRNVVMRNMTVYTRVDHNAARLHCWCGLFYFACQE